MHFTRSTIDSSKRNNLLLMLDKSRRINVISFLITHQRSSALLCPLLLLVIVPSNGNRGSLNDLELDPVPYPELLLDRGGLNDRSYRR